MALKCFVCVRIVGSIYLQLQSQSYKTSACSPSRWLWSLWGRDLCDFWPK